MIWPDTIFSLDRSVRVTVCVSTAVPMSCSCWAAASVSLLSPPQPAIVSSIRQASSPAATRFAFIVYIPPVLPITPWQAH